MGFFPFGPVIGFITPPLPVASGGTGATTATAGLTALGGFVKQSATPAAGTGKINGTQTFATWTAPNDGAQHQFQVIMTQHVTVATEVGGACVLSYTLPDGGATSRTPFAGGSAAGVSNQFNADVLQAGQTVSFAQTSALTSGGPTQVWCEIWGL